ncbi:TetR family transcriptional regulator [Actinomadura barringtoniae]|uniref:TetR family transcriptional regulator n=1 Tax=Actinomadura barringtoniae TaxID=1427535 RepID=A0A939PVY3_9ACTN|nr:TetR/AcrR family transcriptional regulator [Actinomadura barringtoniae]MBO2455821.1 TetR family transcriptional regulator [Actinomadura barringtoniae]
MADEEVRSRRRDAAATRQAILDSARDAFARRGYDGVGVREIAAGAGVTAMLVNRYFGSKEQLFLEVVVGAMNSPEVLRPELIERKDVPRALAEALVRRTGYGDPAPEGLLILLRALSNPVATRTAREQIERHHHRQVAEVMDGPHAPERAALVLSTVVGFQVMRQMYGLGALADADPEVLADLLTAQLEQLFSQGSEDSQG